MAGTPNTPEEIEAYVRDLNAKGIKAEVTNIARPIPARGSIPKVRAKKIPEKLIDPDFKVGFNFVEFTLAVKLEVASTNRGAINKAAFGRPAKYRWAWFSRFPFKMRECLFLIEAAHKGEPVH